MGKKEGRRGRKRKKTEALKRINDGTKSKEKSRAVIFIRMNIKPCK